MTTLLETVDQQATHATSNLDPTRRSELGQFMTPAPVARLMASMLEGGEEHVRILEPGAGVGSLIAAAVAELCDRESRPRRISVVAYELEQLLTLHLAETLDHCRATCDAAGVEFDATVNEGDFIDMAAELLDSGHSLFGHGAPPRFELIITNPPYKKLHSASRHRRLLRSVGIEASNLYAAFLALSIKLLAPGGELVAISPRSFCNGPYFRPFRRLLLEEAAVRRVHIFESRKAAFKEDSVLQENVIFRAVRGADRGEVAITLGNGSREAVASTRHISHDQLVRPADPHSVIHIVTDEAGQEIADQMGRFRTSLEQLGLEVSTGRVVGFRAKPQLRQNPEPGTAPLIYPVHLDRGFVNWPVATRRPNSLHVDDYTRSQLVEAAPYVLVKRFSSKEERRRIVAAVFDPERISCEDSLGLAFENKLNYFHRRGRGLDLQLAKGLSVFLNSTLADSFFRQFSGHTQVNATDLRMMSYPTEEQLLALGALVGSVFPDQDEVDAILAREVLA